MFARPRGAGPLTRNALAPFVDEHRRIPGPGVQCVDILRNHDAVGVEPGTIADPAASVSSPVAVIRVSLHAKVPPPIMVTSTCGGGQVIAGDICRPETTQI